MKKKIKTPEECIEYNQDEATTVVYVPEAYDGETAYGVYLHNTPGANGRSPSPAWRAVMDKLKLIFLSARIKRQTEPLNGTVS